MSLPATTACLPMLWGDGVYVGGRSVGVVLSINVVDRWRVGGSVEQIMPSVKQFVSMG